MGDAMTMYAIHNKVPTDCLVFQKVKVRNFSPHFLETFA